MDSKCSEAEHREALPGLVSRCRRGDREETLTEKTDERSWTKWYTGLAEIESDVNQ